MLGTSTYTNYALINERQEVNKKNMQYAPYFLN